MANVEPAARRYARAAFELALRDGELESWTNALSAIAAFMGESDVRRALENTRVSVESKLRLVDAGLGNLPKLPLNLARLLARKGRTSLASDILAAFTELRDDNQGVIHARARTAVALSPAELADLQQRLEERTGKQVVLETGVDQSLLGGVIIQIGDELIDGSTRARLRALRESLVGAV